MAVKNKDKKTGMEQVADALAHEVEVVFEEDGQKDLPVNPDDENDQEDDGTFRAIRMDWSTGLPKGCPVQPLGKSGDMFYYLDCLGQLQGLKSKDHTKNILQGLFAGKMDFIFKAWPRFGNDKQVKFGQWMAEQATNQLMQCCGVKGIWNPSEKVRGRGAWKNKDGGLMLHFGFGILQDGQWFRPGLIDGMVYPAEEKLPKPPQPTKEVVKVAARYAGDTLTTLQTWNWKRPVIDPVMALGWLAAGKLGGALDWRPLIWVTGGSNSGKSTLQELFKSYLNGGLIWVTDSTQAYIQQRLGHSSLPILLDEAEAEEDNRKLNAMVKLARQASSGGRIGRGGADHKAVDFTVQSSFMFSSILVPPLLPQDKSRIAMLQLQGFSTTTNFKIDHKFIQEAGNAATSRLIARWHRVPDFINLHKEALSKVGHTARGCDQYGALFGLADLMLNDEPTPGLAKKWAEEINAVAMAEIDDDVPDQLQCLNHLLTTGAEYHKNGVNYNIAQVVEEAIEEYTGSDHDSDANSFRILTGFGLRVYKHVDAKGTDQLYLAVANGGAALSKVYQNTQWAARSGAGGGWRQALVRLNGARAAKNPIHIGVTTRCTFIPLGLVLSPSKMGEFRRKPLQGELMGD